MAHILHASAIDMVAAGWKKQSMNILNCLVCAYM